MGVNYWLYKLDVEKKADAIDKGEAIDLEMMDQADKLWKRARVQVFRQPVQQSTPVGLLGPFGEPHDEGRYHVKVLEMLPDNDNE